MVKKKARRKAMGFEKRLERGERSGIVVLERDKAESSRKREVVGMRRRVEYYRKRGINMEEQRRKQRVENIWNK